MVGFVVAGCLAATVLMVCGLVFAEVGCRSGPGRHGLEHPWWARVVAVGLAMVAWSLAMGFIVWLWDPVLCLGGR